MKRRSQTRNAVLCILVVIFAVLVVAIITRAIKHHCVAIASLAVVFGLLGLVLIALTAGLSESRIRKTLFISTGMSAAGIPASVILHNLLYGLFIAWFGERFWGPDGDEPVFLILALFLLPVLFVVSAVASGILLLKTGASRDENGPQ